MLYEILLSFLLGAVTGGPQPIPPTIAAPSAPVVLAELGPRRRTPERIGLQLSAQAAAVVDVRSGQVLYATRGDLPLPTASVAKLATALVFLRLNPGWDMPVTLQEADRRAGGLVVLAPGETVTVRDLFAAMLVSSSNEAAAALQRVSGLDEAAFVGEMNALARELGLTQARFRDPAGLDPGNVASATDVSRLAIAAFAQPEIGEAAGRETYELRLLPSGRTRTIRSTARHFGTFLTDPGQGYGIAGVKTGYLDEAGYNLTAEVAKGGHPVVVTLLGSASSEQRWQELKGLAVWTYQNFEWPRSVTRR